MKKIAFLPLAVAALFLFSCDDMAVSFGDGGGSGSGGGNSGNGNTGGGSGVKTKTYTLTVNASPAGAGTVSLSPNLTSYEAGSGVTATATPATGYKFGSWSGASSSTSGSVYVTMDANKTLTANFEKKQTASTVVITLTSWATTNTDALDNNLDPRITVYVEDSYGLTSSEILLNRDNVGQSWSGSISSSPMSFYGSAAYLYIQFGVIEKDPLSDDNISPSDYTTFYLPVYVGDSGTKTLGSSTSSQSRVTYRYEFK